MPEGGAPSPSDGYAIDLKLLDETTERIAAFVRKLSETMDQIDVGVVQKCAAIWGGVGAETYLARQARWTQAMTQASGEVDEMRIAARTAYGNYSSAKSTNMSMLGR